MRKSIIIAVAAVATLSIPVFAEHHEGRHHEGRHGDGMTAAGPTTRADVENRVKTHFAAVDANKDGFIVSAEADAARANQQAEKRDQHFAGMDSNKDGSISRAEFDVAHQDEATANEGKRGRHMRGGDRPGGRGRQGGGDKMGGLTSGGMFKQADANADGKVSLAEALTKPLARFDTADTNKDGTLTPEERKAARESMRGKWRDKRG
jgi:hypothetical protein